MKFFATLILLAACSAVAFGQQKVGAPAHNFNETTLAGEKVELEDLKGKVVVLTFWSTKCQICVSEIPKLNKLVGKYKNSDVVFLGLTMNNEAMVRNFLKKKPFDFKIIPNGFGVLLKYADRDAQDRLDMGYPAHFVIDRQGRVVLKTNGFKKSEKLDGKISELLAG